jgi:hypothetical protein
MSDLTVMDKTNTVVPRTTDSVIVHCNAHAVSFNMRPRFKFLGLVSFWSRLFSLK